jgi:hypothetical protein
VHQVHLLVLLEVARMLAQFLHADQEKDSIEVHRHAEARFELLAQPAPSFFEYQVYHKGRRAETYLRKAAKVGMGTADREGGAGSSGLNSFGKAEFFYRHGATNAKFSPRHVSRG